MRGKRRKVEPLPLRMELPEELAALAVPEDDPQDATVILNSSEQGAATWRDLRLGVLIPVLFGLAADKLAEWMRHNNKLATAVVATTAGTTLAYSGFNVVLDDNGQPGALPPPPAATVTVTRPAPTWTPEPSATRTRTAPAAAITVPPNPVASDQPDALRTSQPPTPGPSATPSTRTPGVTPVTTTPVPQETPTTAETTNAPTPTGTPTVTPPPTTSAPEPTSATALKDCVLRVDVDPLLDLCVLG